MGINGYSRKPRGVEKRKRVSFVFISAEGNNKTETLYFRQFHDKNVQFKFATGTATDPVKMANDLIKKMDLEGFDVELGDHTYCLIDGDNLPLKNKQIADACDLAKKQGFKVILSNPCFEVWFICHDHFSTKQYSTNNEVYKELKQIFPGFSKTTLPKKELLMEKLPLAIENAKKLCKWNDERGIREHTIEYMPSTEVYKIIEETNLKNTAM